MLTSIRKIISENGIKINQTVYYEERPDILDYKIFSGDFYEFDNYSRLNCKFNIVDKCDNLLETKINNDNAYLELKNRIDFLKNEIIKIKSLQIKGENKNNELNQKIKKYRCEINIKNKKIKELIENYRAEIIKTMFNDETHSNENRYAIKYKNKSFITSFENLKASVPQLKGCNNSFLNSVPLFISQIENLVDSLKNKRKIAIEGGPCIFGMHEELIYIYDIYGKKNVFDFYVASENHYSSYEHYFKNKKRILDEYVEKNHNNILRIEFECFKSSLLSQDKDSFDLLFDFANAINARLVIPFPDFSYKKYIKNVFKKLDKRIMTQAILDFQSDVYKISDLFIDYINKQKKRYPHVDVTIVHDRNIELRDLFQEKKDNMLSSQCQSYRSSITNNKNRIDSITDYLDMPALPFYIYGIKDIIQIDTISELSSYIKCGQVHKNDFNLCSILYPEKPSKSGNETLMAAPIESKNYV